MPKNNNSVPAEKAYNPVGILIVWLTYCSIYDINTTIYKYCYRLTQQVRIWILETYIERNDCRMNTLINRLRIESDIKRECLSRRQLSHSVQTKEETRTHDHGSVHRKGNGEEPVVGYVQSL